MPVDMFPPHKAATHPLGAAPTQPDQCSDHPQQNQPEPPPRPGALATPSACRCRGSCGAELAGGVPIWQVLGRDDPSLCLLTSQISSYPVALAFPGESWFEAAPRLSQLRASFGTHLTWERFWACCGGRQGPFIRRFGARCPGNFPQPLSLPAAPSCRNVLRHHEGHSLVSQPSRKQTSLSTTSCGKSPLAARSSTCVSPGTILMTTLAAAGSEAIGI